MPDKLASLANAIPECGALELSLVTHWGHFLRLVRAAQSNSFLLLLILERHGKAAGTRNHVYPTFSKAGFTSLSMVLLSLDVLKVDTKVSLWKHTELRHSPRVEQQLGSCSKTISNQVLRANGL